MKREFLEGLNLEKDMIDKIMAEHGKDVEGGKAVKAELDALKEQTKTYETQLEELKKADPEALKKTIEDLQAANKQAAADYEAKLKQAARDAKLEARLTEEGAVNVKAVRALLAEDKISLDGDNLVGIDDQIKALKESDKWAFNAVQVPGSPANPPAQQKEKAPLPEGVQVF